MKRIYCASARALATAMFMMALTGLGTAQAATLTWNNAIASGSWTAGANWGGAAPGAGDTANWTFASGSTNIIDVTVPDSNTVGSITMDFAGSTYNTIANTKPTVSLIGSGTSPGLSVGTIMVARADAGANYAFTLMDTLVFSDMNLSVGSIAARGLIQLGEKVGANNTVITGVLRAGTNAGFTAYLTALQLGYNSGSSGVGSGTLDLSKAMDATLDISGNADVGASSSGQNLYRSGTLSLGNGGTGTAGNLYLGYTTAGESISSPYKNGYLNLSNSTFQVGAGGRAYLGGRSGDQAWTFNTAMINITVNGRCGGLDILNSAADGLTLKYPTLTGNDGGNSRIYNQINVTLGGQSVDGWCWGLRWAGEHVTNNTQAFTAGGAKGLLALLDSTNQYARLRVFTSALTDMQLSQHLEYLKNLNPGKYEGKTIADLTPADFIGYDGSNTYVGVYNGCAPLVTNAGAISETNFMMLNGYLVSTGKDANVSATVFWGTNDAGRRAEGWTYTNRLPGVAAEGPLSVNVTPDKAGEPYYFRFFASNGFSQAWASPAHSFIWWADIRTGTVFSTW